MIRSRLSLGFVLAAAVAMAAPPAWAQERVDRTGSRVGSSSTQRMIYRFGESNEVRRVLGLIESGKTEQAVAFARDYVDSLDSAVAVSGTPVPLERYYALNALCVAQTKAGHIEDALATCTRAIEVSSGRWTAFNSRATAHYSARNFEQAAADYRRALDVAPDDEDVRATLEHNLSLAAARLAEPDPG